MPCGFPSLLMKLERPDCLHGRRISTARGVQLLLPGAKPCSQELSTKVLARSKPMPGSRGCPGAAPARGDGAPHLAKSRAARATVESRASIECLAEILGYIA
jgi:hypothetical protein